MENTKAKGNIGEQIAAEYLEAQGYTIKERNATYVGCEIDIICEGCLDIDGDPVKRGKGGERTIVFVEVKRRSDSRYGFGIEAVTRYKVGRYVKAANMYLKRYRLTDVACRFDIIEVDDFDVNHIKNAFAFDDALY